MKDLSLDSIAINTPLDCYLCHKSGTILHKPGEIITDVHIALLRECSITTVVAVESGADPAAVASGMRKKTVPLNEIPVDEPMPVALLDKNGAKVVECGAALTSHRKDLLANSGTESLYYLKDAMELQSFQIDMYRQMLDTDKFENYSILPHEKTAPATPAAEQTVAPTGEDAVPQTVAAEIPSERFFTHPAKSISNSASKEMMQHPEMLELPTFEMTGAEKPKKIVNERTRETAVGYNNRYNDWVGALDPLFASLKANKETSFDEIDAIAVGIIELHFLDVNYCCNLLNLRHPSTSDRYLTTHSINVGIITAGIGILLGFPRWIIREITIGALLHDIGHLMTYRPFLSQKDFTSSEQQKYDNHAVVGMAMLKNITRIPISTMMVVVQHHEKVDGSGRIFHAPASRIHEFAKIVAVADAFETRCRFMNASAALATAISEAQSGKIDLHYAKAMVILLSLYPIGTAVRTAKGTVYKVIGTNRQEFRKPVLRSVYTMQDEHLFPIDKSELVDMKKTTLIITEEVSHSALKSDISQGFYD